MKASTEVKVSLHSKKANCRTRLTYLFDPDDSTETFTRWSQFDLVSDSEHSEVKIDSGHARWSPSPSSRKVSRYMSREISSQLLYYRLTIVFGMAPMGDLDGYKVAWEVRLKHNDGGSVLSFMDYKGSSTVSFEGTTDASEDALRLLNYLISSDCLHTYDGIVAGTIA